MKTKIAATLVALACVASIGFPAAAEDASRGVSLLSDGPAVTAAQPQAVTTTSALRSHPLSSVHFSLLSDVRAEALASKELAAVRGAGSNTTAMRIKMLQQIDRASAINFNYLKADVVEVF